VNRRHSAHPGRDVSRDSLTRSHYATYVTPKSMPGDASISAWLEAAFRLTTSARRRGHRHRPCPATTPRGDRVPTPRRASRPVTQVLCRSPASSRSGSQERLFHRFRIPDLLHAIQAGAVSGRGPVSPGMPFTSSDCGGMWPGIAGCRASLAPDLAPSKFLSIAKVQGIEHKAGRSPPCRRRSRAMARGSHECCLHSTNGPAGNRASSALHGCESGRRRPGSAAAPDTRAAGADVMPPDVKACQDS
jgi:hypothetical protein